MHRFTLFITTLVAVSLLAFLASCEHKALYYPDREKMAVDVRISWDAAPEADPAGMTVLFMPDSPAGELWRFNTPGRNGGTVNPGNGFYTVATYNTDPGNLYVTGATSPDSLTIKLTTTTLYTRTDSVRLPSHAYAAPERFWYGITAPVAVPPDTVVTCHPDSPLRHYTVEVLDVENSQGIRTCMATLDGMASWQRPNAHISAPEPSPIAFRPAKRDNTSLAAQFNTLGPCADPTSPRILSLFVQLQDGQRLRYDYDVSDQVDYAPNPMNVFITVSPLPLPPSGPDKPDGAFDADVEGWDIVHIDLR